MRLSKLLPKDLTTRVGIIAWAGMSFYWTVVFVRAGAPVLAIVLAVLLTTLIAIPIIIWGRWLRDRMKERNRRT